MSADVYFHFDKRNTLLYIGMTTRQFSRQKEHASTKTWWSDVARVECIHLPDKQAALYVEETLIRIFRPVHNVVHNRSWANSEEWTSEEEELHSILSSRAAAGAPLLASQKRLLDRLNAKRSPVVVSPVQKHLDRLRMTS